MVLFFLVVSGEVFFLGEVDDVKIRVLLLDWFSFFVMREAADGESGKELSSGSARLLSEDRLDEVVLVGMHMEQGLLEQVLHLRLCGVA